MINVFNIFVGVSMYMEFLIVTALLKPVREPRGIRDTWYGLLKSGISPTKATGVFVLSLSAGILLDLMWDVIFYHSILVDTDDETLVREFYVSKVLMCVTNFSTSLFLLALIMKLVQFLIVLSGMLEYEIMCRHAILKSANPSIITAVSEHMNLRSNVPRKEISL